MEIQMPSEQKQDAYVWALIGHEKKVPTFPFRKKSKTCSIQW